MSLGWNGYANGRIPASAMHEIPNFLPIFSGVSVGLASNMMMTEAAVQFSGMAEAFYRHFGKPLNVSEAYRRLDRQQSLYADYKAGRGNLAAYPGTSNHGWGRSLDLASNVNINNSPENIWTRQNAPKYGFYFTVPSEAWHVDYLASASIKVPKFISNPNTTAQESSSSGGSSKNEDEMDRILRNKKTGSVDWVNVSTGFIWHVPSTGYIGIVENYIGRKTEDLEDNFHSFYLGRAREHRDAIAAEVWNHNIKASNGVQPAANRLSGADLKADGLSSSSVQKIVDALPDAPTGTTSVDINKLVAALVPLLVPAIVKAVNDDAAKRMQA